jgi:tetratricopeptide (TPR) repeat protein
MLSVVTIGILIARSYYKDINRSVDPRIVHARELYAGYDIHAHSGDYYAIFGLLDSIEEIYHATAHYRDAFEVGVIENNRAAAMLTIALYRDSIPEAADPFAGVPTDSLVSLASYHVHRAISTYERWNLKFSDKSREEMREMIQPGFVKGLEGFEEEMTRSYLETRIREMESAQVENQRRLSVCYSNLGLVHRYRGEYETAAAQYMKAIELWNRNLDAENNLNILLNKPLRKRNFIQKLFPPDKEP